MKAIHNGLNIDPTLKGLLLIKQRYKMKAIHNNLLICLLLHRTVVNKAKIQNESNSQHSTLWRLEITYCC